MIRKLLPEVVCVSLLAYLLYLCLSGFSSPVPRAKPAPKRSVAGSYTMYFHKTAYPTILLDDGGYVCESIPTNRADRPIRWEGTWKLDKDTFTIREQIVDIVTGERGSFTDYVFTLRPGKLESTCDVLRFVK